MRGLSGAVTALILVVASVVIALIVVGFAFGLFGSFGSAGAVTPVGPAYMYTHSPPPNVSAPTSVGPNVVYLEVTMDNRGSNTTITSATINGMTATPYQVDLYNSTTNKVIHILNGVYIPAGQNTLVIVFTGISPNAIGSSPVNVQLYLANGQTVYIAADLVSS
ncbi:MAG: hypothetical protein RXN77_04305 [Sulfolobaceae archaeon]|nr:hypothetical protein [Sulfolobales archaeon]